MTREETIEIMKIISNEFPNFMPPLDEDGTQSSRSKKIDTWHWQFRMFDYVTMQKATLIMLRTRKPYGVPQISELYHVLSPEQEKQNLGIEFSDFVFKHRNTKGTKLIELPDGSYSLDKVEKNGAELVAEKFGEQYVPLFKEYQQIIKESNNDGLSYVRDRLAKRFNSEHERFEIQGHTGIEMSNEQAKNLLTEVRQRARLELGGGNENE